MSPKNKKILKIKSLKLKPQSCTFSIEILRMVKQKIKINRDVTIINTTVKTFVTSQTALKNDLSYTKFRG